MGALKFLAVTTFNARGRQAYGERMMESVHRHWPDGAGFRVYSEGWTNIDTRFAVYDLLEASPWLAGFKARHKDRPTTNYRMDAVRFAHKVAAICHAARGRTRYLIWIDGDTFTHSRMTLADLESLAPADDQWISWLDRKAMYPECGFMVFNCRHPRHMEMIDRLEAMYANDELFALPEWHDSYVIEQVVKQSGIGAKSLSGDARHTSHPLVNGPLGQWLDHMKGKRKAAGRSHKRDLVKPRKEAYWS
ncbi:hypothetical protein [Hyphomonas sp. UBA4494]|jgi:hypothetical protein|uniref:hypothetical protein n=1 Tax=Hyphomonas sp. UBA4494 TaxID=1946631 RepID=UPI0025C71983|nr:hypothetical protein [Hyphomonas sp. UBA4494]